MTKLQNELYRKQIDFWSFVDNEEGGISPVPTKLVRLTTLLDYNDETTRTQLENLYGKFIFEMGLFGADASATKDSGIMFNYKLFKGWKLIENCSLLIHWTISF